MKLTHKALFFALLACTFMVACGPARTLHAYEVWKPINEDDIGSLHKGQTTKEMATKVFGNPYNRIRTEAGETLIYKYFGDSLAIAFNNQNLLNTFTFQPEPFRLLTETPSRTYGSFSGSFLRRLEPGVDKLAALEKRFGLPTRTEMGTERQKVIYRGRNENLVAWITVEDSTFINYIVEEK